MVMVVIAPVPIGAHFDTKIIEQNNKQNKQLNTNSEVTIPVTFQTTFMSTQERDYGN